MLRRFLREEEGQNTVEYALLAALVAVAVIGAIVFFRGVLQNKMSGIANSVSGAQ